MRVFRRYMDFSTGRVTVTHGIMKRVCEYIPDNGSKEPARRVADMSTHWARARVAELERAGLITKEPKASKFEEPVFFCPVARLASLRPEKEPQGNRKDGTASARASQTDTYDSGTANEPQGRNRNIPGIQEEKNPPTPPRGGRREPSTWTLPTGVDAEAWAEFEAHRKDIRKPLSDLSRAKNAAVLAGLTTDQQHASVDATISNRWTGLFPPKTNGTQAPTPAPRQRPRLADLK